MDRFTFYTIKSLPLRLPKAFTPAVLADCCAKHPKSRVQFFEKDANHPQAMVLLTMDASISLKHSFTTTCRDIMNVKQIPLMAENKAPKILGAGEIKYLLWVDDKGALYVQIKDNSTAGTFSPLLFSVAKYASKRNSGTSISKPTGFDLSTKSLRQSENENDGGFLKAVLRYLLPLDKA